MNRTRNGNPWKEVSICVLKHIPRYSSFITRRRLRKRRQQQREGLSDQLQISSIGKDIQTAKAAVAGSSDIREDVIAPIKAKLQNGTYEVSNESFADKLFAKYEEMR